MHAFIFQNSKFKSQNSTDTLIVELDPQAGGSIGIDDVRRIQAFLARKPVQAPENKVYILSAHLLTPPAQNALLKTLEEPPGNSLIYLVTDYPDRLLPTVLSRVQIQNDQIVNPPAGGQEFQKIQKILNDLQGKKIGERLALVDTLDFTREQAIEFLDKLEHYLHQNLGTELNYAAIVQARKYLKANVNIKLAMDYLVLNVISTTP